MSTEKILEERGKTHGDWIMDAGCQMELKAVIERWDTQGIQPHKRASLEMIAVKMARILTGDSTLDDHWDDISGYALLGKRHA